MEKASVYFVWVLLFFLALTSNHVPRFDIDVITDAYPDPDAGFAHLC